MPKPTNFLDLGLAPWICDALKAISITTPTEIQRACIPPTLAGKSVIGGARTGSGKTIAFALPILQKLAEEPFGGFALILTPTSHLFRLATVIGGVDFVAQANQLSGLPHIIVATPGRLVDHLNTNQAIKLERLKFLVLDEADRLLQEEFQPELAVITARLGTKSTRQSLLYTATLTPAIISMKDSTSSGDKPFFYQCDLGLLNVAHGLDQHFVLIPSHVRDVALYMLLTEREEKDPKSTVMIFTAKCRDAELLRIMLQSLGIDCVSLHSKLRQNQRIGAIERFKGGKTKVLIATDVGSRGLDIPSVQLVINYTLPRDPVDYVHRVGRTARAGRGGSAISIITEKDIELIENIEKDIGQKLQEIRMEDDLMVRQLNKITNARRTSILQLYDSRFGEKSANNKRKKLQLEADDDGVRGRGEGVRGGRGEGGRGEGGSGEGGRGEGGRGKKKQKE